MKEYTRLRKDVTIGEILKFGFKEIQDDDYRYENENFYIAKDGVTLVLKNEDNWEEIFKLYCNNLLETTRITEDIGIYGNEKIYILKEEKMEKFYYQNENNEKKFNIQQIINYIGELEDTVEKLYKEKYKGE